MAINNQEELDQKPKSFKVTLWVFLVVIFLTAWIFWYDYYLQNKVSLVESQTQDIASQIETQSKDWYYLIYMQTKENKAILDEYAYNSQIPEFITNLKSLSTQYNIFFEWFAYSNWKISTKATAINDSLNQASVKTKNFIEFFRKANTHIFSLWFVSSFDGQDKINFNVDFNVK